MLNRISIMGRLTRDPELRMTQSQKSVATFTVAVERDYNGGDKQTDFINCVIWNRGAEFLHQHFTRGMMIALVGRLQSRQWTDRDGNKRTEWEVIADNIYFCGDNRQRAASGEPQLVDLPDDDEEEIPF